MNGTRLFLLGLMILASVTVAEARQYHVSPQGADTNAGTATAPLKTIQTAADRAQPGDVITVHEGTYREQVDPPRGGTSDQQRISFRQRPGRRLSSRALRSSSSGRKWRMICGW